MLHFRKCAILYVHGFVLIALKGHALLCCLRL